MPVLWLISMSLQPSDVIFQGGFKIFPNSITINNYLKFAPWSNEQFFNDFCWSVVFYGITSAFAILLGINETYRLVVHSTPKRERHHLAAVIGIFFLPVFAVFNAVELIKSWTSFRIDMYALFAISILSGYALGFVAFYSAFKYGFHNQYEQFLLEFRSPILAFYNGIVRPQAWILCLATVLVFSTNWNELFLSDKWTSSNHWRPFAVDIVTKIEQYRLDYGIIASGAVISMVTPLILGLLLYLLVWVYRLVRLDGRNE
jgi:ABC-type glycerol-3-phosphate transport system permease component